MLTLPALALIAGSAVALVAVVTIGNWRGDRRSLATRAKALETLGRTVQHRRCATELRRVAPHPPVRSGAVTILGPADKRQASSTVHSVSPTLRSATGPVPHPEHLRRVSRPEAAVGNTSASEPTGNTSGPAAPEAGIATPQQVSAGTGDLPDITTELPKTSSPVRRRVLAAAVSVAVMATGALAAGVWTPSPQSRTALESAATGNEVTPVSDPATPGASQPTETTQVAPPPPLATRTESTDTESVSAASPFTLDLAAGNPTWVRVATTAGSTMFEGTLEAGDTVQLRPEEPVDVRMGNSAGLLMGIDGHLVSHSRTEGQPLTVTVRTPPAPGPLPNP